jgi:hypothetical protein
MTDSSKIKMGRPNPALPGWSSSERVNKFRCLCWPNKIQGFYYWSCILASIDVFLAESLYEAIRGPIRIFNDFNCMVTAPASSSIFGRFIVAVILRILPDFSRRSGHFTAAHPENKHGYILPSFGRLRFVAVGSIFYYFRGNFIYVRASGIILQIY